MPERLRVLLVEDSEEDAMLIERSLRKGSFEVEALRVETRAALLEALDAGGWDVVVSDYNLPGFSGTEALALVRERDEDMPFIVVSGAVGEERAVELMRLGAHDYIMKDSLMRLAPAVEREVAEAHVRRQRKVDRERIELSLREKEMLLHEIHHRVKNNMQIITSILKLRLRQSDNDFVRELLRDCQSRIHSMALVHEQLYRSDDLSHINIREYLDELAWSTYRSFALSPSHVQLVLSLDDADLNIDTAIPLGLVLNELLSNAFKHAFVGREHGQVTLTLKRGQDGELAVTVADDGVGLPADSEIMTAETFGMHLVFSLVQQLSAQMDVEREAGTAVTLRFREVPYARRI
jgi:two-component sensor histidine kinase